MNLRKITVVITIMGLVLLGGCGKWKEKYDACNAELENLEALFDGSQQALQVCEADKNQLAQMLDAERNTTRREQTELERAGGVYDAARGTITVTLENKVLFDSGKVKLKSASKSRLSNISGIIKREHGGSEIWVVGHTDTDPIRKSKWKDNWQLSTERSLAVTRYLLTQGVSAKQLVAAGRGEHKPVGSKKSKNRRVEIIVHTY